MTEKTNTQRNIAKCALIAGALAVLAGTSYVAKRTYDENQRIYHPTAIEQSVIMPGQTIDQMAISLRDSNPDYANVDYRDIRKMIYEMNPNLSPSKIYRAGDKIYLPTFIKNLETEVKK